MCGLKKYVLYFGQFFLKHIDRIIIVCAFVYANGLNPELFFEWSELLELGRDRAGPLENILVLYLYILKTEIVVGRYMYLIKQTEGTNIS